MCATACLLRTPTRSLPVLIALPQVVATPYATSFDHIGAADSVYFKFQRCLKALGPSAIALPQFGLGHSFGSLIHLLIDSRYVVGGPVVEF